MGLKKGQKHRRPKDSSFDGSSKQDADLQLQRKLGEWEVLKSKLAKISQNFKDQSLTYLYVYEAAQRLNESGRAVKRGVQKAQSNGDAHANLLRLLLSALKARKRSADATVPASEVCLPAEVQKLSKNVGKHADSLTFAGGALTFGALLYVYGAAPWALPMLYLLFFITCMPQRIWSFCKRKWTFFLIDFCYWANLAAVCYLLFFPAHPQLSAAIYALTDGPLAGAIIVWQCSWVFGSVDHGISVLIHLFPGLAIFAHQHFNSPKGLSEMTTRVLGLLLGNADATTSSPNPAKLTGLDSHFKWLFAAPMLFYFVWQLLYYVIVQVFCRNHILANNYDTSYRCLARRAAKTNNMWNKLVRTGTPFQRCVKFGLLQMMFTVISLTLFAPMYHCFWLASLWQVLKIGLSVYFGSRYQCEYLPRMHFVTGMKTYVAATSSSGQTVN